MCMKPAIYVFSMVDWEDRKGGACEEHAQYLRRYRSHEIKYMRTYRSEQPLR